MSPASLSDTMEVQDIGTLTVHYHPYTVILDITVYPSFNILKHHEMNDKF